MCGYDDVRIMCVMSTNSKIAVLILVLGVVGMVFGLPYLRHVPAGASHDSVSSPATTTPVANTVSPGHLGGYVGAASSTAPSLTMPVAYAADTAPEVKSILVGKIADLRAQVGRNYEDYAAWLNLAIRYKQAGDLKQAETIWLYLAYIHPDDAVSRHDLGDLYAHYLKDYPKAEMYYKQAIGIVPTQAMDYLALSELYRYSYKQGTIAAADILKQGIAKVPAPQVQDLKAALAALQ